ncbi:tripartite tricarboxylate transporter substrate binding protein [Roseomonas sp. OT10]|uniref:Bug family tripartite tricarboxylate transporter substrate binding protein n=1 Tax=Roseomonas cutis TaxID=2897332 RepID=UPI001E58E538|nr:tripartite tricarboxylate transporter substrate binding protein [Roseomonas sp. OT10]UFN50189.1 tripartite tricarboxylate transporter substrate binding protein [Roseomonas sp. OT10]
MLNRRTLLRGAPLITAALALPALRIRPAGATAAAAWPERTLRWVSPFPPGGSLDFSARLIGARMQDRLGRPVVIENRAGGAGAVGSAYVANAAPDGYTVLSSSIGPQSLAPGLTPDLGYDVLRDLTHIGIIGTSPYLLVVKADAPWGDAAALVEAARRAPGQLTGGSSGDGTVAHIALARFAAATGTQILHVPYRGSTAALNDLMAGRISLMLEGVAAARGLVESGQLRALAITRAQRSPLLPEVPSFAEAGLPDMVFAGWQGVAGPRGLPPELASRINAEMNRELAQPAVQARLAEIALETRPCSPAEATAFVARELETWRPHVLAARQQQSGS